MATESSREASDDQIASFIDDLIRDIFREPGAGPESSARGATARAALFETAAGPARPSRRTAMLDRLLLVEAFAAELAESLAHALAEQLAPRIARAMEHLAAEEATGKPATGSRAGQGRKPGAK